MATERMTPAQLRKKVRDARQFLLWAAQALEPARGLDLNHAARCASFAAADLQTVQLELNAQLQNTADQDRAR